MLHPDLCPQHEGQWTKRMSNRAAVGGGINKNVENMNQQVNGKAEGVRDFRCAQPHSHMGVSEVSGVRGVRGVRGVSGVRSHTHALTHRCL